MPNTHMEWGTQTGCLKVGGICYFYGNLVENHISRVTLASFLCILTEILSYPFPIKLSSSIGPNLLSHKFLN